MTSRGRGVVKILHYPNAILALEGVGGKHHAPATLARERDLLSIVRMLGGLWDRSRDGSGNIHPDRDWNPGPSSV